MNLTQIRSAVLKTFHTQRKITTELRRQKQNFLQLTVCDKNQKSKPSFGRLIRRVVWKQIAPILTVPVPARGNTKLGAETKRLQHKLVATLFTRLI